MSAFISSALKSVFVASSTGFVYFDVVYVFSVPDVRVRDYPLMESPVEMTSILLAYVFFSVYVGPRLMANRKPFRLNTAMIIYNLSMVLFNAYIVYEVDKSPWQIVLVFLFFSFLLLLDEDDVFVWAGAVKRMVHLEEQVRVKSGFDLFLFFTVLTVMQHWDIKFSNFPSFISLKL